MVSMNTMAHLLRYQHMWQSVTASCSQKSKDSCFDQSLQKAARATLDNSDTKLDYHPEETNKDEILFYIPHTDIQQGDMQFEVQIGDTRKKEC